MEVMDDCFYTKEHEWIRIDDTSATIGITAYAQSALGDITYVELPEVGFEVEQFEQLASIESVKAASDIFSPMSGRVIAVNEVLLEKPELINRSCYNKGWLAQIEITAMEEKSNLMNAAEYEKYLEGLE